MDERKQIDTQETDRRTGERQTHRQETGRRWMDRETGDGQTDRRWTGYRQRQETIREIGDR